MTTGKDSRKQSEDGSYGLDQDKEATMANFKPLAKCMTYGDTINKKSDPKREDVMQTTVLSRRLMLKIDLCVMPFLCISVFLQFLDKFCIAYAKVMGMNKDLSLTNSEYAWAGSIFYFGYLACLPIATVLLQRVPAHRFITACCFVWGVIMMCHAAVQGSSSLLALRFLLGFFEGAVIPCTTLITANFYTKNQQVLRSAIWQSCNGIAAFAGSGMAYGLLLRQMDILANQDKDQLTSWRVMFLILGGLTVAFSFATFFFLPLSPSRQATVRFLSDEEAELVQQSLRGNLDASMGKGNPRKQYIEAVKDIRLYLFSLVPFATSITNGGYTVFSTTLVASFGFKPAETLLLLMPAGGAQVAAVLIHWTLFRLTKTRTAGACFCLVLSVIGSAMVVGLGNDPSTKAARMAGLCIIVFYVMAQAAVMSFISATVGGHTKRVVFSTCYQVAYAVGNIIGPQTYQSKDAPDFVPAKITMIVTLVVALVAMIGIAVTHLCWNRVRDQRQLGINRKETEGNKSPGLTDKEDSNFRYLY